MSQKNGGRGGNEACIMATSSMDPYYFADCCRPCPIPWAWLASHNSHAWQQRQDFAIQLCE